MRKLTRADYLRTPWKNGGGETLQLAAFPPEAGLGEFVWRLSMATVASAGPFSRFEGVDRTLTVIEGELRLDIEGLGSQLLTASSNPVSFAGDLAARAEPLLGPVTDLNVMTRRAIASHRVLTAVPGEIVAKSPITVLFATAAMELASEQGPIVLLRTDMLFLDPGERSRIVSGTALLVNIDY